MVIPSRLVLCVLHFTGADEVLRIFPNLGAALAAGNLARPQSPADLKPPSPSLTPGATPTPPCFAQCLPGMEGVRPIRQAQVASVARLAG